MKKTIIALGMQLLFASVALASNPYREAAQRFAGSEMARFPEAWQLDHGKRLFFGYAQGVGCCAMLEMWKATGERKYYEYVDRKSVV